MGNPIALAMIPSTSAALPPTTRARTPNDGAPALRCADCGTPETSYTATLVAGGARLAFCLDDIIRRDERGDFVTGSARAVAPRGASVTRVGPIAAFHTVGSPDAADATTARAEGAR